MESNYKTIAHLIYKLLDVCDVVWLVVGQCLHDINQCTNYSDSPLMPLWLKFLKQTSNTQATECIQLWKRMQNLGYTIDTLYYLLATHNPLAYCEIKTREIALFVYQENNSISNVNINFANILYNVSKYKNIRGYTYTYRSYWQQINHVEFCDYLYADHQILIKQCVEYINFFDSITNITTICEKIFGNYVPNIIAHTISKYCVPNKFVIKFIESYKSNNGDYFTEILEIIRSSFVRSNRGSHNLLLPFNNGVYDLITNNLRNAVPQDNFFHCYNMEYNTQINAEYAIQLDSYLNKILADPHIREYTLTLLACVLTGSEKMICVVIDKNNSSSHLFELLRLTFNCSVETCDLQILYDGQVENTQNCRYYLCKDENNICNFMYSQEIYNIPLYAIDTLNSFLGPDNVCQTVDTQTTQCTPFLFINELPDIPNVRQNKRFFKHLSGYHMYCKVFDHLKLIEFASEYSDIDNATLHNWTNAFMHLMISYHTKYLQNKYTIPQIYADIHAQYRTKLNLTN